MHLVRDVDAAEGYPGTEGSRANRCMRGGDKPPRCSIFGRGCRGLADRGGGRRVLTASPAMPQVTRRPWPRYHATNTRAPPRRRQFAHHEGRGFGTSTRFCRTFFLDWALVFFFFCCSRIFISFHLLLDQEKEDLARRVSAEDFLSIERC